MERNSFWRRFVKFLDISAIREVFKFLFELGQVIVYVSIAPFAYVARFVIKQVQWLLDLHLLWLIAAVMWIGDSSSWH